MKGESCNTVEARPETQRPSTCVSCHVKDDVQKEKLGPKCTDCHTEYEWKTVVFDHDMQSRFPLKAKHADVKCKDCHCVLHTSDAADDLLSFDLDDLRHIKKLSLELSICHS